MFTLNSILNPFKTHAVKQGIVLIFWFLALYPGRISYDNVQLLRIIREGKSTNWWTAEYFWIIKIFSFHGRYPSVVAAIFLAISFYSVRKLIISITQEKSIQEKSILFLTLTPIFSVFSLTISHDVLASSGIILLVALEISNRHNKNLDKKAQIEQFVACVLLLTVHSGVFVIAAVIIRNIFRKGIIHNLFFLLSILMVHLFSLTGVTNTLPDYRYLWPLAADIKCIVQHPDSDLPSETWGILTQMADKATWKRQVPCSNADLTGVVFENYKYSNEFNLKFIKLYSSLVSRNPQIAITSHLQKSQGILPPPFFSGPANMVDLNPNKPLGFNSNSSLIVGQEVLHSSVDGEEFKTNLKVTKLLEPLALFPTYLINQASWFWGWGGFWMYFPVVFAFTRRDFRILYRFYPLVVMIAISIATLPIASIRYFTWEILIGLSFMIILINELLASLKRNKSEFSTLNNQKHE